jgi:succinyl-CoA synthetase alpha subunit
MVVKNIIRENTYLDSIILMSMSDQLRQLDGVEEVSAIMGTEANKEILKNIGLLEQEGERAKPGDLIIAVKAQNEKSSIGVIRKSEELLTKRALVVDGHEEALPISYDSALEMMPAANLVVVSVPGQYAGSVAMEALESGRHVMIFSDNVPLHEEIELKKRARELGLIVMGPDCGTAIINGTALGFANAVRSGPFGIVGASGTGIQEVSSLLHRRGFGITQAIGLGGRDLSLEVMGMSMLQGIEALENDPGTETIILISKPPAAEVAQKILDTVQNQKKRYIVNFLNGDPAEAEKRGITFASGLEEAVELAISVREGRDRRTSAFTGYAEGIIHGAEEERKKIGGGKYLRGLFSGGTLADEALVILGEYIGGVHSNVPLSEELRLADSWKSFQHTIVDLGEDEFTRGKPHPMIDFALRSERLAREAADPGCGVVLLDVVLGHGAHPDPAGTLAPLIREAKKRAVHEGRYLAFVASVTGTDEDPQNFTIQKQVLEESGVAVLPSNAQAANYAGLLLRGN